MWRLQRLYADARARACGSAGVVCVCATAWRSSPRGPRLCSVVTVWACGGVRCGAGAPSRAAPACRLSLMHDGEEREKEKKASQCHDSCECREFLPIHTHTHNRCPRTHSSVVRDLVGGTVLSTSRSHTSPSEFWVDPPPELAMQRWASEAALPLDGGPRQAAANHDRRDPFTSGVCLTRAGSVWNNIFHARG